MKSPAYQACPVVSEAPEGIAARQIDLICADQLMIV
jgi:hypothetical protein